MEQVYHSHELVYWVEAWLTDDEWSIGESVQREAHLAAAAIPTGDHWS